MFGLIENKLVPNEIVNFGASNEKENIEIVEEILRITGASGDLVQYVKDRPGHDRRYAMGFEKAKRILDWGPLVNWEQGISETVEWYLRNQDWVNSVRTGEYLNWLDRHYG